MKQPGRLVVFAEEACVPSPEDDMSNVGVVLDFLGFFGDIADCNEVFVGVLVGRDCGSE